MSAGIAGPESSSDDTERGGESERGRELAREQAHIDRAYEALDRLREGAASTSPDTVEADDSAGGTFQVRFERERAQADARRRLGELRWGDPPLVFGRIDFADDPAAAGSDRADLAGARFHIGRIGVSDEAHDQLVVDWRAPVAEGFYRATRTAPLGLARRRGFHCRGRTLLGIDDTVLSGAGVIDEAVVGDAALLAALDAPRSGRMRDAVATVQTEQDEVIRAPMAGVTIVQGAAGTGKTVVALHRAAYLLYTFRDVLDRQGVLVLGPNARFLDYVRDVLPALGEHEARLATVHELFPGVVAVAEGPDAAEVKARLAMARVIGRAVKMRQRLVRADVGIPVGRFLLKLPVDVVNGIVREVRGLAGTHNRRRRFVEHDLLAALLAEFRRRNDVPSGRMADPGPEGFRALVTGTAEWRALLERIWPLLTPQALLHGLFGSTALLRHAGRGGVLDDRGVDIVYRPGVTSEADVAWTDADVPLLHEAYSLLGPLPGVARRDDEITEDEQLIVDRVIDGVRRSMELPMDAVMEADLRRSVLDEVRTDMGRGDDDEHPTGPAVPGIWGSVLVDEAQDISPMAWRMIARSCPNQAMTVVGDLAQGTEPWSPDSWDDVARWIGVRRPPRRHELHVNYRTPAEIMVWAAPFAHAAGPTESGPGSGRPRTVARAVRSTGIEPVAVRVETALVASAVAVRARSLRGRVGDGTVGVVATEAMLADLTTLLDDGIELHTPKTVKGLEFDGVVVVEPADLWAGIGRPAPLYIALTRATTHLVVVHSGPLPPALREVAAPTS